MIRVENLSKRYGLTAAVDGLSFEVRPGVVTGFLGPNGAGKSTTMRAIVGLDTPTAGRVTVNGVCYRDLPAPMREVGVLLDAQAVHGGRSAAAHLAWVARAAGIPRRRVTEVLDLVGLADVAGKRVGGFSLGMRQRLGIATALLGDPPVLLFDEPVNGLDPDGIRWIRTLLQELAAQGRTVLVSSHVMNEMQETAQHVVVIGRGRLIADLPIGELTAGNARSHIRVVSPTADRLAGVLTGAGATVTRTGEGALAVIGLAMPRIGELAFDHRIVVHELAPVRASLETAFMDLTRDSLAHRSGQPIRPTPPRRRPTRSTRPTPPTPSHVSEH